MDLGFTSSKACGAELLWVTLGDPHDVVKGGIMDLMVVIESLWVVVMQSNDVKLYCRKCHYIAIRQQ